MNQKRLGNHVFDFQVFSYYAVPMYFFQDSVVEFKEQSVFVSKTKLDVLLVSGVRKRKKKFNQGAKIWYETLIELLCFFTDQIVSERIHHLHGSIIEH